MARGGAQSVAEDAFRRSAIDQIPEWQVPYDPDDRSYMMLMYQEHAELARQQEYLRAFWSALLVLFGSVMLMTARDEVRQWPSGATLLAVGVIGAFTLSKHNARYNLHVSVMRSFRLALAETVRSDISRLSTAIRLQHDRSNRWLRLISLHRMFVLLALAMIGGGAEMIWRSVEAEPSAIAERPLTAAVASVRNPDIAVAPASGQP